MWDSCEILERGMLGTQEENIGLRVTDLGRSLAPVQS
jgi:hypothetical protein